MILYGVLPGCQLSVVMLLPCFYAKKCFRSTEGMTWASPSQSVLPAKMSEFLCWCSERGCAGQVFPAGEDRTTFSVSLQLCSSNADRQPPGFDRELKFLLRAVLCEDTTLIWQELW